MIKSTIAPIFPLPYFGKNRLEGVALLFLVLGEFSLCHFSPVNVGSVTVNQIKD